MTPQERYQKLSALLMQESPELVEVLSEYQLLDKVGYKTGLLKPEHSYAESLSWWPLISVLGTFSAGKSSFINGLIGKKVQTTGNQAVDDKFTVICYGNQEAVLTLPGLALDADPRFPFYGISAQIEKVEQGEGKRLDSYLQLKTTAADILRGKILIDSPGFDADAQRNATLRMSKHIIDLSDLVLVFFDARHPEPGAMRDTLKHLVQATRQRHDANKIVYILNQIDTAAKEDNLEEVMSAWQKALASEGLVGGHLLALYHPAAADLGENASVNERFARRREQDMQALLTRMEKVQVERSYRIIHSLENLAHEIEWVQIPKLKNELKRWRLQVLSIEAALLATLISLLTTLWFLYDFNIASITESSIWALLQNSAIFGFSTALLLFFSIFAMHHWLRAQLVRRRQTQLQQQNEHALADALAFNTPFWRGMFYASPRGWKTKTRKWLSKIHQSAKAQIQRRNDRYTNPSGETLLK
ncbi:MAG: dynamin family protein [Thiotrichales bacterium]|nr:dynamin family protein [Thiotrichales bacterium]